MANLLAEKLQQADNAITEHHLNNLINETYARSDGGVQTVYTAQVNDPRLNNGQPTLIPQIWDGKELTTEESIERAIQSKKQWPTRNTHPELRNYDIDIHKSFDEDLRLLGN
tara:strand:- start:414 stop:749 length:336 start_codon:yes stop_codon:yes gene_type:complete